MMTIDRYLTTLPPNHEKPPISREVDKVVGAEFNGFTDVTVERATDIIRWSNGVESELVDAPVAVKNILLEVLSAGSVDYEAASIAIEQLLEGARAILCVELTFLRTLTVGLGRRCQRRPIGEQKSIGMVESAMVAADHVIWPQFEALGVLFGRVQALSGAGDLNKPENVEHRQAFFDELERIIQDFVKGFVGNSSLIAEVRQGVIDLQIEFNEKDALDERL